MVMAAAYQDAWDAVVLRLDGQKEGVEIVRGWRTATVRDERRSEAAGGLSVYVVVAGNVVRDGRYRRERIEEVVEMTMKMRTTQ